MHPTSFPLVLIILHGFCIFILPFTQHWYSNSNTFVIYSTAFSVTAAIYSNLWNYCETKRSCFFKYYLEWWLFSTETGTSKCVFRYDVPVSSFILNTTRRDQWWTCRVESKNCVYLLYGLRMLLKVSVVYLKGKKIRFQGKWKRRNIHRCSFSHLYVNTDMVIRMVTK